MEQSVEITLLGMGGVFFFLYLLIELINLVRISVRSDSTQQPLNTIAVAIAVARRNRHQK